MAAPRPHRGRRVPLGADADPGAATARSGYRRVLVVDDNATIRGLLVRMLKRLSIEVVEEAADGADAVRRLEDGSFDLVICDLSMPGEDGFVLLRRLGTLVRAPAVVLISGSDPDVLNAASRLGAGQGLTILGVAAKPLTLATLRSILGTTAAPAAAARGPAPIFLSRAAIEEAIRTRRVEVWFQPQYDLRNRRVVGAEALLRMRDPELGVLLPGSFIRPAEDHGLIAALTDYCVEDAFRWLTRDACRALNVSINLSPRLLDDLDFPDRTAAAAARYGVNPSRVTVEVTETALVSNPMSALDITARLRLKGFRLSLDDFGTGHASLEQLQDLPFQEVKLARQFVANALRDDRARTIVQNGARLARELGLVAVSEGVEDSAVLAFVAELGCQVAQGFGIGRPMAAEMFESWLADRQRDRQWLPNQLEHARLASPVHATDGRASGATVAAHLADAVGPHLEAAMTACDNLQRRVTEASAMADIKRVHAAVAAVVRLVRGLKRTEDPGGESLDS